jgi:hypothetical protein
VTSQPPAVMNSNGPTTSTIPVPVNTTHKDTTRNPDPYAQAGGVSVIAVDSLDIVQTNVHKGE